MTAHEEQRQAERMKIHGMMTELVKLNTGGKDGPRPAARAGGSPCSLTSLETRGFIDYAWGEEKNATLPPVLRS